MLVSSKGHVRISPHDLVQKPTEQRAQSELVQSALKITLSAQMGQLDCQLAAGDVSVAKQLVPQSGFLFEEVPKDVGSSRAF